MLSQRRAQSVLEYALIITVVAAGLISMQVYLKRGVQGRLRVTSEQIGDNFEPQQLNLVRETFVNGTTSTTEYYPDEAGGAMSNKTTDELIKTSEKDTWGNP